MNFGEFSPLELNRLLSCVTCMQREFFKDQEHFDIYNDLELLRMKLAAVYRRELNKKG